VLVVLLEGRVEMEVLVAEAEAAASALLALTAAQAATVQQ
jgi:hypothetical protein